MDGENNGKPYEQMDDLGCFPPIFGNIHISRPILQATYHPLHLHQWCPPCIGHIRVSAAAQQCCSALTKALEIHPEIHDFSQQKMKSMIFLRLTKRCFKKKLRKMFQKHVQRYVSKNIFLGLGFFLAMTLGSKKSPNYYG